MGTVRKNRGSWVADFRDRTGRRHIETPKGRFETKQLQKRAAYELLSRRLWEIKSGCFTPNRQRMTFKRLAETWITSKTNIGETIPSVDLIMLECFLLPYFGNRKAETLTRLNIQKFRGEMQRGLPEYCRLAREAKQREARITGKLLKPLKPPGIRTINKCLDVIESILGYAKEIRALAENVAEGIEKVPDFRARC